MNIFLFSKIIIGIEIKSHSLYAKWSKETRRRCDGDGHTHAQRCLIYIIGRGKKLMEH